MIKIILCALNEAQNLKKLIPDLSRELRNLKQDFQIILCIDGSTDESLTLLTDFQKNHPVRILDVINRRGLGPACNRVYSAAIENANNDDLVIYLDSDNTHLPSQLGEMISHFHKNNLDVLTASRFCDKSTMETFPLRRKLISIMASLLLTNLIAIRKISGEKLLDYTSGYRIYRGTKLKKLYEIYGEKFIAEPDFTSTCEIILKLGRINSRIDEIPLIYDYGQKIGKSKFRFFRNSWNLFNLLYKYFFSDEIKKLSK